MGQDMTTKTQPRNVPGDISGNNCSFFFDVSKPMLNVKII